MESLGIPNVFGAQLFVCLVASDCNEAIARLWIAAVPSARRAVFDNGVSVCRGAMAAM